MQLTVNIKSNISLFFLRERSLIYLQVIGYVEFLVLKHWHNLKTELAAINYLTVFNISFREG